MSICASVRQIWKPQLCSLVYHRRLNCYCLDRSISSYIASRIESIQKTYATASELGRNPVRKHQIQPEYGDEQADARRNYRLSAASTGKLFTTTYVKRCQRMTTCCSDIKVKLCRLGGYCIPAQNAPPPKVP